VDGWYLVVALDGRGAVRCLFKLTGNHKFPFVKYNIRDKGRDTVRHCVPAAGLSLLPLPAFSKTNRVRFEMESEVSEMCCLCQTTSE
jgi:hypothetical protein